MIYFSNIVNLFFKAIMWSIFFKRITIEELKNYKGANDIKVTKENDYFIIINKDSTKDYLTD